MADKNELFELPARNDPFAARPKRFLPEKESDEESCAAFGFVRGLNDRALAIEFRLRNGNREGFSYSHLASWRFNPSVGLLLKFTADVTTLVLVEGSNLNLEPPGKSINLIDRGIARHRITFIREMDEDELSANKDTPTIDNIRIDDFQTQEAQEDWLKKYAPAFARK